MSFLCCLLLPSSVRGSDFVAGQPGTLFGRRCYEIVRPVRALRSIAAKNFHSGGKGESNFGCWGEVLFLRSDLLEYFKRTVLAVVFLVFSVAQRSILFLSRVEGWEGDSSIWQCNRFLVVGDGVGTAGRFLNRMCE